MIRRITCVLIGLGVLAMGGRAEQAPAAALADLKTTAEASGFKSTSTYDDVVKFMKAVDAASPLVHYTTYGTTHEGRAMPMAVVGLGLRDASAASVRGTNRLRIHIQGNIHAGEVEGKESAQILLRELAQGKHAEWLKTTVLLITPIFNADGNEKFSLDNRRGQNGPINGMGTRANGQNININRDFMKLESPEGRAFVRLWNEYDPHVGFDLHTSDGSYHGYYLTYSPPLHPNTSPAIMTLMKGEWFPFVTKTIKQKYGWDTFYYGNAAMPGGRGRRGDPAAAGAGRGDAQAAGRAATPPPLPDVVGGQAPAGALREWATFEHVPRFHNNYVGMRNRFALLSEAYAYATFEDRIKATNYFVEEAINFAHANADRVRKTVEAADRESLVNTTLATRAQMVRRGEIDILMGEVEPEVNPNNGATMNRRKNVVKPEKMIDRLWFEPTMTEEVPAEFYVPAEATQALDLLRAHGIQLAPVTQPVTGVERFAISANTTQPVRQNSIDTGAHALRRLEGKWEPAPDARVPAGSFVVRMQQPLARVAFYLLAPTSDDGLVNWNVLDDLLKDGAPYPILRKR